MDKILENIKTELEAKKVDIQRNAVGYALNGLLGLLPDRKTEIDAIFLENKKKVAWEKTMIILGSEIEKIVRGRMIVPEYSQKGCAKQQIYVFIGTHWELAMIQVYYDFVKEAARCVGLSEVIVQDQDFMNRLFENVAFRVSKHISTVEPHREVWINLNNCTVEVHNDGSIATHEHRAEDFFLYCLPYEYNPTSECPGFHAFLDEVLPEKEAQDLLGEYIGYCFTRNLKLEKMAVFYGAGSNGKSVLMDLIKRMMGRSNVSEGTLSSVTNDPEARAMLQDKLVNISTESKKELNTAVLKMLVSGEAVEMRILYVGTRLLHNPPKLITAYNELPPIENTHGYRRRWLLFPFNVMIPSERQDPALADRLAMEMPGILNWVFERLSVLLANVNSNKGNSFTTSRICVEALDNYFKNANTVTMFLEDACTVTDSVANKMKDLYMSYQDYCRAYGIKKPAILKKFKQELIKWGATQRTNMQVCYFNVAVDTTVYS